MNEPKKADPLNSAGFVATLASGSERIAGNVASLQLAAMGGTDKHRRSARNNLADGLIHTAGVRTAHARDLVQAVEGEANDIANAVPTIYEHSDFIAAKAKLFEDLSSQVRYPEARSPMVKVCRELGATPRIAKLLTARAAQEWDTQNRGPGFHG